MDSRLPHGITRCLRAALADASGSVAAASGPFFGLRLGDFMFLKLCPAEDTSALSRRLESLTDPADNLQEADAMIKLTRLNGNPMMINSDLIKTAEASPDTMLTLINGEKLIVREELDEVIQRVLCYRARLLATVASHLPAIEDLQRAAAISSLEVSAPPDETSTFLQFTHTDK